MEDGGYFFLEKSIFSLLVGIIYIYGEKEFKKISTKDYNLNK